MTTILISEQEFYSSILAKLKNITAGCVTGPGRSGAIAAVYASHILHIPFIPYGSMHPKNIGTILIIDTAEESGKTMKKAAKKYKDSEKVLITVYKEPPRVMFWYEAPKPQLYKHEIVYKTFLTKKEAV